MLITEATARTKWCPFVRIEGSNRLDNTMTGGFEHSGSQYHCIGGSCMVWRELHLSHMKGMTHLPDERHGYCGLAERPDLEQGW